MPHPPGDPQRFAAALLKQHRDADAEDATLARDPQRFAAALLKPENAMANMYDISA